jgi:hypothetical protein
MTVLLRDALLEGPARVGVDGTGGLVGYCEKTARENPAAYLSVLGKLVPPVKDGNPVSPENYLPLIVNVQPIRGGTYLSAEEIERYDSASAHRAPKVLELETVEVKPEAPSDLVPLAEYTPPANVVKLKPHEP